ncbi:MAG TPA: hypothetical protein VFV30_08855 [Novosphingobium sp.]|nr:hypothetical protein [Novosphingobium sp.]
MIRLLAVSALLLTAAAPGLPYPSYGASALQRKADLSISAIPIDTPLAKVKGRLTKVPGSCEADGNCEWRDKAGVRHYFWGDVKPSPLVIKFVHAKDFRGRPIRALGIGMARSKPAVIKAVKAFDPRIKLDCDRARVSGNVGPQECSFTTNPGWIQIGFDRNDQLTMIRFDGYQFT